MLHAIIMAGGSGTRFWPKSRRDRPKQLLRLAGEATMLQQTVARIEPLVPRDRILDHHRGRPGRGDAGSAPRPAGRERDRRAVPRATRPRAWAWRPGSSPSRDPEGTMIVMPADHVIEPAEAFRATVRAAVAVIDDDPSALVTFGIKPTRPETGYGYIERGALLENTRRHPGPPGRPVPREARPGHGRAVPGRRQLRLELGDLRLASPDDPGRDPDPSPAAGRGPRADPPSHRHPDEAETLARLFPRLERVPIDKAVMEHAPNVRVLEVPYDWNDVGDWRALASLLERDAAGNAIQGNVVARDTTGSIIISDDGGLVATLGVDDLVVVHSGKATLVARKDQLDKLKALVEGLGEAGTGRIFDRHSARIEISRPSASRPDGIDRDRPTRRGSA